MSHSKVLHPFCPHIFVDDILPRINVNDVPEVVEDRLETRLALEKCERLSASGFMADIFRLTFSIQVADDENYNERKTDLSQKVDVILKAPTLRQFQALNGIDEATVDSIAFSIRKSHQVESTFYLKVAPHFASMPGSRFNAPKLFYVKDSTLKPETLQKNDDSHNGFMVMEDVSVRNRSAYGIVPIADGLRKNQVEAAIRLIAQFHAASLTLPSSLMDEFSLKLQLSIQEESYHMVEALCSLSDTDYFQRYEAVLLKLVADHGVMAPDEHKLFGLRPVLSHGDYHHLNIFFKRTADAETTEFFTDEIGSVVDYQCAKTGTGVNDMIRLIFVGVQPELRREHMEAWKRLYFGEFRAQVARLQVPPAADGLRELETYEQFEHVFEHHQHYELIFAMFHCKNVATAGADASARHRLLQRAVELFEDYKHLYLDNKTTTKDKQKLDKTMQL